MEERGGGNVLHFTHNGVFTKDAMIMFRDKYREWYLSEELWEEDWCIFYTGVCPAPKFRFHAVPEEISPVKAAAGHFILGEIYVDKTESADGLSPLEHHWRKLVGRALLPYDAVHRERELSGAFNALSSYVAHYLQ